MASAPHLSRDVAGLAALLATSGVVHLVRPQVFEGIVPRVLPNHRALVYVSGVAELLCAAGLLHPATRRPAGYASAALLVAVFPANVQMSVDSGQRAQRTGRPGIPGRLRRDPGPAAAAGADDPHGAAGGRPMRRS